VNLDGVLQNIAQFLGMEDELATVQGTRELLDAFAALLNEDLPDVGGFHAGVPYREVDGQDLTLDVIVPKGNGPFPVLVYFHGGAWVWGSPATHRKLTFRLAEQGFLTMSVDYRLAPEHPFPSGFNDCVHAVHFAAHNASRWGGDPDRLALAGDSAGGNLAAATAIELAHTIGAPAVRAVALLYGVFDFTGAESAADGITGLLTDAYLGGELALLPTSSLAALIR
jgi:acetyl esterase